MGEDNYNGYEKKGTLCKPKGKLVAQYRGPGNEQDDGQENSKEIQVTVVPLQDTGYNLVSFPFAFPFSFFDNGNPLLVDLHISAKQHNGVFDKEPTTEIRIKSRFNITAITEFK